MNNRNKQDILNDVEAALEAVRGPLSRHNGGVQAVDFDMETGRLSVRFLGMCDGCPLADQTLHTIIGDTVESAVPEVREVVHV
jgi:Fe-S cluster biogenesis protein NfuA